MTGSHSLRVDDIMPLCGMRAVRAAPWLQVCIFDSWVDPDAQHEGGKWLEPVVKKAIIQDRTAALISDSAKCR